MISLAAKTASGSIVTVNEIFDGAVMIAGIRELPNDKYQKISIVFSAEAITVLTNLLVEYQKETTT